MAHQGADSSIPLTYHDSRDLGLICIEKKGKILASRIFLKKRVHFANTSKTVQNAHFEIKTSSFLRYSTFMMFTMMMNNANGTLTHKVQNKLFHFRIRHSPATLNSHFSFQLKCPTSRITAQQLKIK